MRMTMPGLLEDLLGDEQDFRRTPARPAGLAHRALHGVLGAWAELRARSATLRRETVLEPNKDSRVKIQRYSFALSTEVELGKKGVALVMTGQPDVFFRPQRVVMNAPHVGFAIIDEIKVANVTVTIGDGREDAYSYSAGAHADLDMPLCRPSNKITVLGEMTGRFGGVPYESGEEFLFTASFRGPATIV